jgi:hypothetical protein
MSITLMFPSASLSTWSSTFPPQRPAFGELIRLEAALNQWGMEAHLAFLEVAKRDPEAARCLSSRKLYPQAVFFLQQSVEKATKSFGLWAKVVTEGEVKDAVGHDAWKVFSKIFGEFYGDWRSWLRPSRPSRGLRSPA